MYLLEYFIHHKVSDTLIHLHMLMYENIFLIHNIFRMKNKIKRSF